MRGKVVIEANAVADQGAVISPGFFCNASGDGPRRNAARLSVTDSPVDAAPCCETQFWQLRRLTTTRRAADHEHLMSLKEFLQLGNVCRDRQRVRKFEMWHECCPPLPNVRRVLALVLQSLRTCHTHLQRRRVHREAAGLAPELFQLARNTATIAEQKEQLSATVAALEAKLAEQTEALAAAVKKRQVAEDMRRSDALLCKRILAASSATREKAPPALVDGGSYPVLSRAGSGSDGDSPTRSGGGGRRRGGGGNLQLVAYNGANGHHGHHHHKRRSQGALAKITGVAKAVTHHSRRLFINAPSTLVGVLTGREHGAELFAPHGDRMERLFDELGMDTRCAFTRAQRAAFLLQYNGDVSKAALAMERSLKWRKKYRFIPDKDLKRFEDVVFVHGGRHAYTGGVHLVLRLSAVSAAERSEGLDAVAAALISHVEAQWRQLHVHGDNPGKMRGRLVALVDCAGVTTTSFPASLVAHTLVTLDHNYPDLAAEVHVVNVW